ncbi:hypothetical protein ACKS0A_08793 [Histoplasma ohiense]
MQIDYSSWTSTLHFVTLWRMRSAHIPPTPPSPPRVPDFLKQQRNQKKKKKKKKLQLKAAQKSCGAARS